MQRSKLYLPQKNLSCKACSSLTGFTLFFSVRPWDNITDLFEYEHEFRVRTRTRIQAPMVKQQSLVAMEVHPPSADEGGTPRVPMSSKARRKCGRHSPDRMSSMDEDEVTSFALSLQPLRESQAELKEQFRSIRSDMKRYQAVNQEELSKFHAKDWALFFFLAIALLWQLYAHSKQTSCTLLHK